MVSAPRPLSTDDADRDDFPARSGLLRWLDTAVIAGVLVVAVIARFTARTPMWLDEALTVQISRLPVGEIPGALRHDGHPPLYYVLSHFWMQVFGNSDTAVRALAGVFGVAAIPLVWLAARRLGGRGAAWTATVLFAVMPFAVRYSTENRMYSLMMVWGLAAWLLGQRALRKPDVRTLAALALVTAGMLWTHYWGLWFGAAAAGCLLLKWWQAHKQGERDAQANSLRVLGALAVGFVLFLPWVPSLLYQAAHTGTPWARRAWPTTVLAFTIQDAGGGAKADSQIFGWFIFIAAVLGVFGYAVDRRRITLDLRGLARPREAAILAGGTLALATVVGIVTNSAFQPRYNAIWIPLWVLLAGCGLVQLRAPVVRRAALAALVVLAVPGITRSAFETRSQAGSAAKVIARDASAGSVVIVCPDQLGPSLLRAFEHRGVPVHDGSPGVVKTGIRVIAYPRFDTPYRIDWVDYEKRVRSVNPRSYAREVSMRYPNERLFVVWDGTYRTHRLVCERFAQELLLLRGGSRAILTNSAKIYEHEWVVEYGPVKTP